MVAPASWDNPPSPGHQPVRNPTPACQPSGAGADAHPEGMPFTDLHIDVYLKAQVCTLENALWTSVLPTGR